MATFQEGRSRNYTTRTTRGHMFLRDVFDLPTSKGFWVRLK